MLPAERAAHPAQVRDHVCTKFECIAAARPYANHIHRSSTRTHAGSGFNASARVPMLIIWLGALGDRPCWLALHLIVRQANVRREGQNMDAPSEDLVGLDLAVSCER